MDAPKSLSPRYVAILALVAGLILIGGWLARPRAIPQNAAAVPSATELQQLERRAERRALESMADYFEGVAREVQPSIAYLPGIGLSGIVWDDGRIVTAPHEGKPASGRVAVVTGTSKDAAQLDIWGARLPLATLLLAGGKVGGASLRRADTSLRPGDWLIAVWRTNTEAAFAAGNLQQTGAGVCAGTTVQEVSTNLILRRPMAGGGLFDLDGRLVAVLLPCPSGMAAIAIASVQALIERENTVQSRLIRRYGVDLGVASGEQQRHLTFTDGVLVREVWTGSVGDLAGLQPGDVITELAGKATASVDDLRPMTNPSGAPFSLTVRRGSRTVVVDLLADERVVDSDPAAAGDDVMLQSASGSYRVERVRPGSRAATAGVLPGDRLIRIDHAEPRNLQHARSLLSGMPSMPRLLEVQREGRRLAIFVP